MRTLLAATLLLAGAHANAQTLTVAIPQDATSIDPHFQDIGPNANVARQIFDSLVTAGRTAELRPGLALTWQLTEDPTQWRLTLRQGVTFHDGTPFTAEDAAFSLKRIVAVPNAPSTMGRFVRDIREVQVVDASTLLIRTAEPSAILPNNLTNVPIVPAKIGAAAEPKDFNNGQHAIGTGPYRFVRWTPGAEIAFAGNAAWWGGAPNWQSIRMRPVVNNGARVAALLAGDVDLIAAVPTADLPRLKSDPKLSVWESVSNRDVFWTMDTSRETTPHATAKDGTAIPNPFRDIRVRQAVMLGINRKALLDRIMEGVAVPATQLVPIGMAGYDPAITLPDFDPAKARALLAEAGYPQGFKLTIHSTAGRYANDQQQAEAIAQMLSRIGIQTTVETQPVGMFFQNARKQAFTFNIVSWGFATGDTYVLIRETLHSKGLENYGRHTNPAIDAVLDQARTDTNPTSRGNAIAQAQRLAIQDVAVIPTHYQLNLWAGRRGLRMEPRMDEMTLGQDIFPAP